MQQHLRVGLLRLVMLIWLIATGTTGGQSFARDVQKASQANNTEEEIVYDFAANPELINGLATGITGWNNSNKNATIVINSYTFTLYNCLRGSSYLSIRGDYNDKDSGADPGYVRSSMKGTMTRLDIQKRAGGAGTISIIFEKEDGTTISVDKEVTAAAALVSIDIPEDKQVADAKSITVKPNFKLGVSKFVIKRMVATPETQEPWVLFRTLNADQNKATTFDTSASTYNVTAGQIVQLVSNGIEGFDPVSTMSNPYVVTYTVCSTTATAEESTPTFSAQTNSSHKFWRNGNDKDDSGNLIGGKGYVYRRGIVLSKEKDDNGQAGTSHKGESLKVTVKIFKIDEVQDNKCTAYHEVQTIEKTFYFDNEADRPDYGAAKHIDFTPYTGTKTALTPIDNVYTKPNSIAVLDPTENITVFQTGWPYENTIVAKLSMDDVYDLQSLLNSASVSPTKSKKVMKSSSLKYRKVSAMQYTHDGLASKAIAEACYWFIPERKNLMLRASSQLLNDTKIALDKSQTDKQTDVVTLHAYYKDGEQEHAVSLKDLNFGKSNITFTDKAVASLKGDITFNEAGDAMFTLQADDNGFTSIAIRTLQTNNVTANTTDETTETADNYTAANTTFSVEVTGGDRLMPPIVTPFTQEYSNDFNATIEGIKDLKTYYFVTFDGGISTMSTEGQDDTSDATSGSSVGGIEANEIVEMAIKIQNGNKDKGTPYGGIIDGEATIQVPINAKDNAKYTIYAVTANVGENGKVNTPIDNNSSRIISSVYTFNRLENPVLSPGIESNAYPFSGNSLSIEANVEATNAKIYYSLGKELTFDVTSDGIMSTNGTLFSSDKPIVIDGSTYVQAIAYNDSLRLTSDIVTYRYAKKSTDINEPTFVIDNETYTNGDKYIHSLNETQVQLMASVYDEDGNETIIGGSNVNWATDKYHIYYTIDGNDISASSLQYKGPFTIDNTQKNVKITAAVYADGTDGDKSISDASVLYVLDSGISYWETSTQNCGNDGVLKSLSTSINDANGKELVKVQFGSNKKADEAPLTWKHYVSKEYATGNPIDNIGKYTIAPALDADEEVADVKDEMGNLWNHSKANDNTAQFQTHKATYGLPASGAYVKFEPQQNGTLTIWCCQEGALFYSNKSTDKASFNEGFIRKRPAYFVDEAGHSIAPTDIKAAGVLSYNWNMEANTSYWNVKGGEPVNGITQNLYTSKQANAIYNMFNNVILANNAKLNSPLQPLIVRLNTEENKEVAGFNVAQAPLDEADDTGLNYTPDNNIDGTGICLPSASYMKYTFDVKAGKTYFFFGWMTKIGIRGLGFEPSTNDMMADELNILTGKDGTNNSNDNDFSTNKGKSYKNVVVKRKFLKDTWTTLVLPFSVSASKVEEVFGTGTQVLHYSTIDGTKMCFFKHYHQMVVAGTPVLIKPTKEVNNAVFENVTIDLTTVEDKPCYDYVEDGNTNYQMRGSFTTQTYGNGNYYISSAGTVKQLYRADGTKAQLPGTRAYIEGIGPDGTVARIMQLSRTSFDDSTPRDMDGETTDIDVVVDNGHGETYIHTLGKNKVYNMDGQLMRSDNSTEGLGKGVYIIDGKKQTVK